MTGPGLITSMATGVWPEWLVLSEVGVYAFVVYCVGCLALTRWRMTLRRSWFVAGIMTIALAAIPLIGSTIEWQRQRRDAVEPIVVVARDVAMRSGNGVEYPSKGDLTRGCEVRRIGERGGWLHIETSSGAVGWLPADAVTVSDEPPGRS